MGKKRDQANANINILIDWVCDLKRIPLDNGNCPYYDNPKVRSQCTNDCAICKDEYIENLRNSLIEEYIVR